jgi:zinc finger SWIM domain-containing protein 3
MDVLNEIESVEIVDQTPHIDMEFDSLDEAWNFWVSYGGKMGFNTRKGFINHRKDGPITSRWFVCSNEGYRTSDNRNRELKDPELKLEPDALFVFPLS